MKKKNRVLPNSLKWIFAVLVAIFIYFVYIFFAPNFTYEGSDKQYLCIPDSTSELELNQLIEREFKVYNMSSLNQVMIILHYKNIRSGQYLVTKGMSNFLFVRMLRSGRQTPVQLKFNNIRTKEQLAGRLSVQLMADSIQILNLLNDSAFLAKSGLNPNNSISIFIPNTYEVFWNMDAQDIFNRMKKEYENFWTNERKSKADSIPLTPLEVSTLASIVEEETNGKVERPVVAGLYINRLKINMPLQADPTLKFAVGNFALRRITGEQIKVNSPYNTYKNTGLPPGPIRVATPQGIDAVLNYQQHKYIFMCAKETLNGEHNFAENYIEHQRNARKYQKALNDRMIYK
jgi:UPF0755 protein